MIKKGNKTILIVLLALLVFSLVSCKNLVGEATRISSKSLPAYQEKCSDSDDGINLEEKGITKGLMLQRDGSKKPTAKIDSCLKNGKLVEYYCSRDLIKGTIKECSNGKICKDGMCFLEQQIDQETLWQQTNGPEGGEALLSITISSQNPNLLFTGAKSDLYKSTNAGQDWSLIHSFLFNEQKDEIAAIIMDTNDDNLLYVLTVFSGFYKSVDGGETWVKTSSNIEGTHRVLSMSKSNPNILAFATHNPGKIFLSTNAGESWDEITGNVNTDKITAIGIINEQEIYLGGGGSLEGEIGKLYHTTNGGNSWEILDLGQPKESFVRSIFVGEDSNLILIGMGDSYNRMWHNVVGNNGGYLFRSENGGNNWEDVVITTSLDSSIQFLKGSTNTIYMGTNKLYKSIDFGKSWSVLETPCWEEFPCFDFFEIAIDPLNENNLYLPIGSGLIKSIDSGGSWFLSQNGIISTTPTNLITDPNNPGVIYAGTMGFASGGVHKTSDNGQTWELVSDTGIKHPFVDDLYINPSNNAEVYAISDKSQVFKSTNAGQSWETMITSTGGPGMPVIPGFRFESVSAMAVAPSDPEQMYIIRDGFGVMKSKEGFRDMAQGGWEYKPFSSDYSYALAVDPTDPNIVYAGYNRKVFEENAKLFKLASAEENWEEIHEFPNAFSISSLEINPDNPNNVYAGVTGENGNIYQTNDAGNTWSKLNEDFTFSTIHVTATDPNNENVVYAAPWGGGLFKSENGGNVWTELKTPTMSIPAIIVGPENSNHLIIADRIRPKIYESFNGGQSWTELVSLDEEKYYRISTMTIHKGELYFSAFNKITGMISLFIDGPMSGTTFKLEEGTPIKISNGVEGNIIIDFFSDNTYLYSVSHIYGVHRLEGNNWVDISPNLDMGFNNIIVANSNLYLSGASDIDMDLNFRIGDSNIVNNIYKSFDNGETWTPLLINNPFSSSVKKLLQYPKNPDVLFAATQNGLFVSIDSGLTWVEENNNLGFRNIGSMSINENKIYVGTLGGGVYPGTINPDYSVSWSASTGPTPNIRNIQIKLDPQEPAIIYASSFPGGVFKSIDAGQTWLESNFALPSFEVEDPLTQGYYSLEIDPEDSNVLYLGIFKKGVYKSTDGAATWLPMYGSMGQNKDLMKKGITKLKVDPTNNNHIYLATDEGVFFSDDGAENWETFNAGLHTTDIATLTFSQDGILYAGTKGYGVYYYNKQEGQWKQVSTIGNYGIFWSWWERPMYQFSDMIINPENNNIMYISSFPTGMYKSVNGGKDWKQKNIGFNADGFDGIFSLVFHPDNKNIIYAGTYNGVSVTYDGANHWERISNGIPEEQWPFSIAIDSNNPDIIYAATKNGMDKGLCSPICVSSNQCDCHLQPNDFRGTVVKTTDGGKSWFEITNGLNKENEFYQIIIYPKNHNVLFLSTEKEGVFMSKNAGNNWQAINDGLMNIRAAVSNNVGVNLVLDSEADYLYFGTSGSGVWRADLSKLDLS